MQLTKHHGLGNDFLVAMVTELPEDATDLAKAVCDRTRGIGADGLIFGLPGSSAAKSDAAMVLFNADGSRAEMSGNGIRCLAQALIMINTVTPSTPNTFRIHTDAGLRKVTTHSTDNPNVLSAKVDMGQISAGPNLNNLAGRDFLVTQGLTKHLETVALGNPHLVVGVDNLDDYSFEQLSEELSVIAASVNIEFVTLGENPNSIKMKVWERGAGPTQACGTGACAAAHAAHGWGLVGQQVKVLMAGGEVTVELGQDSVMLTGPAEFIAKVDYA